MVFKASQVVPRILRPTPVRSFSAGRVSGFPGSMWSPPGPLWCWTLLDSLLTLTVPLSMGLWSGTRTGPSESSMVRLCPWDPSAPGTEAPVCSLFCPFRAFLHYLNTSDSVIQHLLLYSCSCLQSSPWLHRPVCCCPRYSPLAPADPPAPFLSCSACTYCFIMPPCLLVSHWVGPVRSPS